MTDLHKAISGALFDFAGFLTTRPKSTPFGSCEDANAAVELLQEWAGTRGLQLDEADVMRWSEALAAPVVPKTVQERNNAVVALYDKPVVPPGYALVPVNPTPEMLRAACNAIRWYEKEVTARSVYAAMLAAAPKPKGQTT